MGVCKDVKGRPLFAYSKNIIGYVGLLHTNLVASFYGSPCSLYIREATLGYSFFLFVSFIIFSLSKLSPGARALKYTTG